MSVGFGIFVRKEGEGLGCILNEGRKRKENLCKRKK